MSTASPIQKYVDQHNLDKIVKDLVTCTLYYRPEKPLKFMVEALASLEERGEITSATTDYATLFREIAQKKESLKNPRGVNFGATEAPVVTTQVSPEKKKVGFSAEDESPKSPKPPQSPTQATVNFNRKRRGSVSAESLKPTDEDKSDRVIIPKTDEQRMRIFSAIANNLLFRNLESDQRQEVTDAMFEKRVPAGESIIKQGDEGDNFYVVDDGTFEVLVNGNKVVEIGPGGSFGELALMYNTPRAATVKAKEDSVVWAVDRVTFRRIVMNNTFRKRKMYENFVRTVPILQSLEPEERVKVADALEPQTFTDGDNIIEEGDAGDCFYVIVAGEVVVTKKMKRKNEDGTEDDNASEVEVEVNRLQKGSYFGELALLTDKPRAATVTAIGDVECVCLDTKAFIRLLGPVTEILKRNADMYARYAPAIPNTPLTGDE